LRPLLAATVALTKPQMSQTMTTTGCYG
jgi:hypothetical protein